MLSRRSLVVALVLVDSAAVVGVAVVVCADIVFFTGVALSLS